MNQAENVIQDYITFAKPNLYSSTRLDLIKVVKESIKIVEPIAKHNDVAIQLKFDEAQIIGESKLLQKCLVNLLENAIEAMSEGGTLIVEIALSLNGEATILIEDTGIGMTPEQKNRLGEPFFSTKEFKGTGLGTMVAFRIIDVMGGNFLIESEVGVGTRIFITFPMAKEEQNSSLAVI